MQDAVDGLAGAVGRLRRATRHRIFAENVRWRHQFLDFLDAQVVGILDIQSDKRNSFTEDDLVIFEAVADNIAMAIHNADLYRTEQWRRRVGDSLREVAGWSWVDGAIEKTFRFPGDRRLLLGPGDDCAVLSPSRGHRLVATTDAPERSAASATPGPCRWSSSCSTGRPPG